jgi:hypothetical protein
MAKLDIVRFRRGSEQLTVQGVPSTESRVELIEEAIRRIQADGAAALRKEFLGIKNYAAFGDQRCDCRYGMGPRHGHIVFRIGRRDRYNAGTLDADAIYFLEAVRDFVSTDVDAYEAGWPWRGPHSQRSDTQTLNLQEVVKRALDCKAWLDAYDGRIKAVEVDAHV